LTALRTALSVVVDEAEPVVGDFRRDLGAQLPIAARAAAVTLLEEQPDETWAARGAFPPGGA
jgi:hypothetical protein